MVILNLGCGSRTSAQCINIDWSVYLRIKKSKIASLLAPLVLYSSPLRLERLRALDDRIIAHNFLKGIPFGDASVDAVYHSHLLEHLDRSDAVRFVREVHRVLKPKSIHRIVVPNFEDLCRRYLNHLERCIGDGTEHGKHDNYIADIISQMVRREAFGTSQQRPFRRWIENILIGDARRRGETHQWMYDRVNLGHLLECAGFSKIKLLDYSTSAIPKWNLIGLDRNQHGGEYIQGSIYVEAIR